MYRIVQKDKLNDIVERMVIHAPYVARKCEPGQFVMVRVEDNGERIPLTIADFNREQETVTVIYQVVGFTTKLLSQKEEGQYLLDFAGPLGRPVEPKACRRVIGIAGGVGAAPLYPQLRQYASIGTRVDVILGGRSSDFVILEDLFGEICENIHVVTNDGTAGIQGFVTDVLSKLLDDGNIYDEAIAIGPLAMMKAVVGLTKPRGIPTGVSLNPIMIDGTGMCGGCRVTVGGATKFACVDGPDFDGWEVDFYECIRRQGMYKEMEAHVCQIGLGG
ncbi:sulfide/dihydroorotate dehydrogenase-like FAD/NAD-binding protein [Gorillibacterium massiliense]|uniref:sulfide/dihydroorotate dehydrogenase-like FAD/NAD-binding protein n=1 Tax=Gorillibacterium massiliense TaxID=1280390 RepID=UPI0004AEB4A7|nr:sulfide/dihydroorotate dehydrogenase-like FAD/NAD-binding protein [Gorillibacterium massiliense]